MRAKISGCVMTYNEEANIDRALRSIVWCDEIVVLDSYSTDRTVEIARTYTDRILQHPWQGYIAQRNVLRRKASHDWVLFLDADEEITPALRVEIEETLSRNNGRYEGFRIPRTTRYLGRWIKHGEWYPDMTLRLFARVRGRSVGEEPHDRVIVEGPTKDLKTPLLHYSHDDIRDHIQNINNFSSISSRAKFEKGVRFHFHDLLLRPPLRFLKGYVLKGGFLAGWRGYVISVMSMFCALAKYAKLWELEIEARCQQTNPPPDAGSNKEPDA